MNKKAEVIRVYLPPDANCLLSVADHCLRSRDYVNVIVAGKQPALNYLTIDEAIVHCTRGAGIWEWASNDEGQEPDVVLACCGDVPTLETLAAAALLREHLPELKVRVVNVVDLMRLQPPSEHPHGMSDLEFDALFTASRPVIFAYHGYPWLIHRLTYRRTNHDNIHVRGYKEEGTTTTPFDMVMLNDLDRYHLVMDAIDRVAVARRHGRAPPPADGRHPDRAPAVDAPPRGRPPRRARLDLAGLKPILVVNAGSTSLKLRLVDADESVTTVESLDDVSPGAIAAVGHRVVHGGSLFREAVLVDDDVRAGIHELEAIAPLHNAPALDGIEAATRAFPDVPQVAAFDTAFHATIPDEASTYAIPRRWREDWGIRRYGFHGLSVAWSVERAGALDRRDQPRRLPPRRRVIRDGDPRRPLGRHDDGLQPARGRAHEHTLGLGRPGRARLPAARSEVSSAEELDDALNHESGLQALAGTTGAALERAAAAGDPDAELALEVYAHRVAGAVAAMAVAAGRLDALVLTGGIGEGSAAVRERICNRLDLLGVSVDTARNAAAAPDCDVGDRDGAVPVLVIAAREELVIARAARAVLS